MTGVIEPITKQYDVALTPLRGNNSETWVYDIAEIWRGIDQPIFAYYLGDHDPNGLDIERDFRQRLEGYPEGRPYNWQRFGGHSCRFSRSPVSAIPFRCGVL